MLRPFTWIRGLLSTGCKRRPILSRSRRSALSFDILEDRIALNSAPIASDGDLYVQHDQALTNVDFRPFVYDADGDDLDITIVTPPATGIYSQNADGTINFAPPANTAGTITLTYTATDLVDTSDVKTVTIHVLNIVPVARDASAYVLHDRISNIDLRPHVYEADGDDVQIIIVDGDGVGGTATAGANGTVVFTPDPGFTGETTFTYKATDGVAASNVATVTVTVTNTAPVAVGDNYTVPHDQPLDVMEAEGVLANDLDDDFDFLTATVVPGFGPAHGTVTLDP